MCVTSGKRYDISETALTQKLIVNKL